MGYFVVVYVLECVVDVVDLGDVDVDVFDDIVCEFEIDDVVDVDLVFGDEEYVVEYVFDDVLGVEI